MPVNTNSWVIERVNELWTESGSNDIIKESIIKQAFELLIRKATAQRGIGFQEIEGPMTKHVQIFSRVAGFGPAFIFPELHIEYPMQFVFNAQWLRLASRICLHKQFCDIL